MPFSAIISSMDSRKSLLGSTDAFTTAKLSASGGGAAAGGAFFLHRGDAAAAARRGLLARVLRRRPPKDTEERLPELPFPPCSETELGRGVAAWRTTCRSFFFAAAGLVAIGRSTRSDTSSSAWRSKMMSVSDAITLPVKTSFVDDGVFFAGFLSCLPTSPSRPTQVSRLWRWVASGTWATGAGSGLPTGPTLCRLL
ncbi:hypothetical protein PR202_ga05451 [Eleusine coracana subsp. coracana]|uniref:Uncharacterized protein n=1 Tax=Eleusine coracana subsp. coracana TaxID=191504 RepID=A0AAV5BR03_ELECO|nr:hypothetical protein PR202_ga04998 [Eleusine coracana subsp. coracana]GJM89277.1 hypothetical protein PR202_ga05451 [Eleusine coracana subsp. coracana]